MKQNMQGCSPKNSTRALTIIIGFCGENEKISRPTETVDAATMNNIA
jgi:hypothetical protein